MQRYNPMTKCLETVKTNDRKTVDNDIALLINRIMKDAQKIQDVSKEMLRNKLAERIDERGRKNLNTMIVMLEKSIQELANISYRSYPFKDRKTVDSKTFYYVTYYVMGRGKETKYFDNKNDAIKFYNSTKAADKPKSVTYNNPQKIEELEEHIKYQNYRY